jgi:hypothetical protein
LQGKRRPVEANHSDVARIARRQKFVGLPQGRNDAADHFVVVAEHALDVRVLRQGVEHHLVGVVRDPFRIERFDFNAGEFFHLLREALVAQFGLFRPGRAAGFEYDALIADRARQFVGAHRAARDIVEVDDREIFSFRRRVLHDEHRNLGLVGPFHAGNQQFGVEWIDQQRVGFLGDGVENLGHLKVGIALAVDHVRNDARVGGPLLDAVDERDLIFKL